MVNRRNDEIPESLAIVIYGATGDITHRKIMPGLFMLYKDGSLPKKTKIIAYARREKNSESYRGEVIDSLHNFLAITSDENALAKSFSRIIHYHQFDYHELDGFIELKKELSSFAPQRTIYYLATSSVDFVAITEHLGGVRLNTKDSIIVAEKPFGHDEKSAMVLDQTLKKYFSESQIFRIDHYLGKEAIQNIISARFSNVFDHLLNRDFVDHIQIIADEKVGVEKRGGYYDRTGALRDMVQNHLLQMLALATMDAPMKMDTRSIRDGKIKALSAIRKFSRVDYLKDTVFGQYGEGEIDGVKVRGYRSEERVGNGSSTDTFAALKVFLDNRRWKGVPIYMRTGKRLARKVTKITYVFKRAGLSKKGVPNAIELQIFPDEEVFIRINVKKKGRDFSTTPLTLGICQAKEQRTAMQEAYARLLYDSMLGDQTLFVRADETFETWRFIDSITRWWGKHPMKFPNYAAGSRGPKEADTLIRRDKREWML